MALPGGRSLYYNESEHGHDHALDHEFALTNIVYIEGNNNSRGNGPQTSVGSGSSGNGSNNDNSMEITAVQKMVSAMSGSLLTSLLGMLYNYLVSL